MPKPKAGESEKDFMGRCMSFPDMQKYPADQRAAICHSKYGEKMKARFKCVECKHETANEDSTDMTCPECGGELQEIGKPVKMKLETKELHDVEIFEAGTWKGKPYTEKDIDEMIQHVNDRLVEPYININHDNDLTGRWKKDLNVGSFGFINGMKREGTKLLANFKQVPKLIAELIEAGFLKKRSIELWNKYKHANGNLYNNFLEAVTFHGADGLPAVNSLADIVKLYKTDIKTNEQNEQIGEKVEIDLEELKTSKKVRFHIMEISKEEYDRLITEAAKAKEADSIKMKAEKIAEETAQEKTETVKMKADMDKKEAEFAEYKAGVEKMKAETLKVEAETFVKGIVEGKKLLPKFADMKVAEYIRLKNDEKAFSLFKEELESRDIILNFGTISGASESGKIEFKTLDSDSRPGADPTARAEETIQTIMRRDNCDWITAAKKSGIPGVV